MYIQELNSINFPGRHSGTGVHFGKCAIYGTTNESLSMKILKFLTCMTSKDFAFLVDSGSFLEYIRDLIFISDLGSQGRGTCENFYRDARAIFLGFKLTKMSFFLGFAKLASFFGG